MFPFRDLTRKANSHMTDSNPAFGTTHGLARESGSSVEAEARFAALMRQSILGIVESDLDSRFSMVNDCFCRMLGYSREELLGKRCLNFVLAEDVRVAEGRNRSSAISPRPIRAG